MANSRSKVKLSEAFDAKTGRFQYWRKFIGGRRFVLTVDRTQSEIIATALLAAWAKLAASGNGWTDEAIRTAYAEGGVIREVSHQIEPFRNYAAVDLTNADIVTSDRPAKRRLMLYAAIDLYLAEYRSRTKWSRHQREAVAMATYKAFQADVPLDQIEADHLRAAVGHFRQRPVTRTGLPMAVATVQTTLKSVKALFDWLDAADKWIAPRRFERLLRVSYESLKTSIEIKKESFGVETFTIDELAKLYAVATRRQRLYLALMLNVGETAQGLANLLKDDLIRDGDTLTVDRMRTKTSTRGVYPLWPETAALLDAEMNRDPSQPLLLLTADGYPLVHENRKGTGRIDVIDKTWRQSLSKRVVGVRPLSAKYLRKTGASMIAKITGSEGVAQLYLSHRPQSVAGKHYLSKDFSDLAAALTKLRTILAPMFDAATVATPSTAIQNVAGAA